MRRARHPLQADAGMSLGRQAVLGLLLAVLLLRALIPSGFMPGWDRAANEGQRRWLIVCETSPLQALLGQRAHCDGGAQGRDHDSHRLREAHLGCLFAGAMGAALPGAVLHLWLLRSAASERVQRLPAAIFPAPQQRLAAARAPPVSS